MEFLIVAVALYLTYFVLNKFSPTIDSIVDISNAKAVMVSSDQKFANGKRRAKLLEKAKDLGTVPTVKELNALLDGKASKPTED